MKNLAPCWKKIPTLVCAFALIAGAVIGCGRVGDAVAQDMLRDMAFFAGIKDRSTGSPGSEKAADYILKAFRQAGLQEVGVQDFLTPIPEVVSASLEVDGQPPLEIYPWGPNMVYLPTTPPEGLTGSLIYVGAGNFADLNGKKIQGNIVLMDMFSFQNWLNASMLGAKALIFLGSGDSSRGQFKEKDIPTPVAFPRYWVPQRIGEQLKQLALQQNVSATVKSKARWQHKLVYNCYGILPGKSPELRNELIVLDAFYDASSHILGLAPGAGESTSIAMMLLLARELAKNPPDRSVLFLAATGHGQGLAGMRQFTWAVTTRRKILRRDKRNLSLQKEDVDHQIELLEAGDPLAIDDPKDRDRIWQIVLERAKDKVDELTREMQYQKSASETEELVDMADVRPYRRLSWVSSMDQLTPEQEILARELLDGVIPELKVRRDELKLRRQVLRSTEQLSRKLIDLEPVLYLDLNLSSHSPFVGLAELGHTFPIRQDVKRIVRSRRLADILTATGEQAARETGTSNMFKNLLRGSEALGSFGQCHTGQCLCCDIAAIGGLPAVGLVTLDDNRSFWSTPNDTLDRVDVDTIERLQRFFPTFLSKVFSHEELASGITGQLRGLSGLEGTTKFIRQGELFADQPAPGTIVNVIQGDSIFRGMSFQDGTFFIPGLANRRASYQKLIVEPYGVDSQTGLIKWTADKNQTGKVNYRIKVKTDLASTSLIMFHCRQTDVVGIFDPRDMGHLTKVELLNAATETTPVRYWYSRIDGRDTNAISVFLERGTRFKLILSQSMISKELFLLNSTDEIPTGKGFLIGSPASIFLVPKQVAGDLQYLVGRRLTNLFKHGISNRYLQVINETSEQALAASRQSLANQVYDKFWRNTVAAWAQMNVVYSQIESTERDVLTGVMFFIALFVPFAYCMERYLFSFRDIYRQIIAFIVILLMTIFTIRALHPAFQLTYSPMVVIIAFFIVGLSLLVAWIIFMRFEREMDELHDSYAVANRRTDQVSKWQAFGAGFAIGVSNLNRRKLRTALTCITLVILTFTVMSFTNVKSLHKTTSTNLAQENPYTGILIRHQFWFPLTTLLLSDMQARFSEGSSVWPRSWIMPGEMRTQAITSVRRPAMSAPAEGVLGLGWNAPEYFRNIVIHGRWFTEDERNAILLPVDMAQQLGLDPRTDLAATVTLMGDAFEVVGYFDAKLMEASKDLDQNPITPAYEEMLHSQDLSEAEIEAMQSGEQMAPISQKFRFANPKATVIIPFSTCMQYGGKPMAISILPSDGQQPLQIADGLSTWLAYPLFVGQDGIWYHSASTTVRYQGVANLIVPILIVIFICLNTLIGHVHERQREIGTYTSVGLAPTHVGFLFIVEALSMAVISTVIGYILAQLSANYLGNTGLFAQLTFNYSSLASVACMFLVFSVVFLAALYPARMAAEIAMPDINRSWSLPQAEGEEIVMHLPFLLKYEEEKGIMGFLHAFYSSHQDVSQGAFIVDETEMDVDAPELVQGRMPAPVCLLLRMNVWLAPFDFGIKQRLQLHCCPSPDNPGYLEVALRMIRLSGERSAWERANKSFIKALRKQMLLWRLMDPAAKGHYQQLAPVDYAGQLEEA
ncbi:FtsX-like permease family protein [Desulfoferrobacter suflitae]|uniref:FtsX-like permease family protein n=1 Tax=Desulfoferrobacter suflitae TaxID=2865782 RepID=UPI0021644E4D|nr:FtsX-like permease family protein [Desulfoferrobacter suflitae]MCK8602966.1 FtsX-like permease family protein [Desulfoferrobacter suflitae]